VLTIHSPNGDVTIRAVDRPDVIVAYDSDSDADDLGEAELSIEARGNQIEIRPHPRFEIGSAGIAGEIDLDSIVGQISRAFRFAGPFFSAKPGKAAISFEEHDWPDIAVEVPRLIGGRVEVHSANGDVHVEGFTGEIALNTMSGDLRVVRTGGNHTLQAANGDLIIEDTSGRLTARAASGDVRITSAEIDRFEIQTASGDIVVDAVLAGDGPFRAQAASGDVHLAVRRPAARGEEPAATLTFRTVAGDAQVTPPFRRAGRHRWQSGAGEGGPRIDITTVNGDLSAAIAATEGVVAAPGWTSAQDDVSPAPSLVAVDRSQGGRELAADDRPDEEGPTTIDSAARLEVLEAVERGEIDVEEALRRLDVADAGVNP
jgi:DUF4097 and DUF4098 domain-containing protein YvlB